ncbi:hypothetical protein [Bartonella rattimassiliensis]|nr:hypothetical protein [Bartonella rattimassiliensis]
MKSTRKRFKSLGWLVYGIERKENFLAVYQLPDCEVQILYNNEIAIDSLQFDVGFSITMGILAAVCRAIDLINSQSLTGSITVF